MADALSLDTTARFFGVIGTNLLLSGDNAVVIALASRGLPEELRRKAIFYGASGAVLLRIFFAAVVAALLVVPYLQLVGGLLLFGIAWQLVNGGSGDHDVKAESTVWSAVRVIVFADAIMSLDNVIALVGVSGGNLWLLGFGVVLTIPLVIWGSTVLSRLLDHFPVLVYAGSALLAWVASEMVLADKTVSGFFPDRTLPIELALTAAFVVALITYPKLRRSPK